MSFRPILNSGCFGRALTLAVVLLATSQLSACFSFNPKSLRAMDSAIEASNPNLEITSSMKFGVGALTMDFIDLAFVHDRSLDISRIGRAEVGIYEFDGTLDVENFQVPAVFSGDANCPRREIIVRIREPDEQVQIAVCVRGERITGFAVFVLAPNEIVVINARGRFDKLISKVVRDNMGKPQRAVGDQA